MDNKILMQDAVLIAAEIIFSVVLFFIANYAEKSSSTKWRLVYLIPSAVALVAVSLAGFEKIMTGVYIGAVINSAGFFRDKVKVRHICCIACAVLIAGTIPVIMICGSYRTPDYLADFEQGFAQMKRRYVLSELKGIDWDSLYSKYYPQFESAQKDHDSIADCGAWLRLCAEFHDGHVGFIPADTDDYEKTYRKLMGNDYGLVIISLDDGRTVAVEVDNSLNSKGIHNGTVITEWNGLDPEEADKLSSAYDIIPYADIDNRDFYRTVLAAGTGGGDTAQVTFIDDSGEDHTININKLGDYYDRYNDAMEKLNQGADAGNVSWTKTDDNTACLRIKSMFYDAKTYTDTDFSEMKSEINKCVQQIRSEVTKNVIIDIRDNGGGSASLSKSIAELFSPQGEHFFCYETDKNGRYVTGEKSTFQGQDILDGGRVVLLVNSNSISAADHLAVMMDQLDNTAKMGFTEPFGSGQAVSVINLGSGMISLSASLLLDENGDIFVDSGIDGQAKSDLDVRVPFDSEAATAIYDRCEDYLMNTASEYLNNISSLS